MREMKRSPTHPGEILLNDYLEPLGLGISRVAVRLGVSRKTVSKIINGRGAVVPDMALRLSKAFDTTPELWINLQRNFDLWHAGREDRAWRHIRAFPRLHDHEEHLMAA
jgi:addiction module HigA family antidote